MPVKSNDSMAEAPHDEVDALRNFAAAIAQALPNLAAMATDNGLGLGDVSGLPTSKTAAAIRKQAPVVVENLVAAMDGRLNGSYDGYTSCPVVTGYDIPIIAEFNYDKQPVDTFPFDQSKERFSMFMLKKVGQPALYWHGMLKGSA